MSVASIRFLFVLLVGHAGMLRADELLSIRYKDIETSSSNMVIFIPKRKNDQHREGHYSNIKRSSKITCPVSFTEQLLDLLPDQNGSSFPVLRKIVQQRDGKVFHRKLGISYTTLRQEFIEHLSLFVDDVKKFGLHSIKSGGASNPALRNVNGELLDRHVGWKNSKSKRRYVKFRTEDLLSVTEAMGI